MQVIAQTINLIPANKFYPEGANSWMLGFLNEFDLNDMIIDKDYVCLESKKGRVFIISKTKLHGAFEPEEPALLFQTEEQLKELKNTIMSSSTKIRINYEEELLEVKKMTAIRKRLPSHEVYFIEENNEWKERKEYV